MTFYASEMLNNFDFLYFWRDSRKLKLKNKAIKQLVVTQE